MLRFQVFGIPVAVHWLFWLNAVLLGGGISAQSPEELQRLMLWILAAFASVLVHEMGHAFTMRTFGARCHIMLYALGGLAIPDRGFSRGRHVLVSLAGPVVEIAFGIAAYFLLKVSLSAVDFEDVGFHLHSGMHGYTDQFLWEFAWVSVFWGLINLVPVYPLDGGQVLFFSLGPQFSRITFGVSIVFAAGVALWLGTTGQIFAALFFGVMAFENLQRLRGVSNPSILSPR